MFQSQEAGALHDYHADVFLVQLFLDEVLQGILHGQGIDFLHSHAYGSGDGGGIDSHGLRVVQPAAGARVFLKAGHSGGGVVEQNNHMPVGRPVVDHVHEAGKPAVHEGTVSDDGVIRLPAVHMQSLLLIMEDMLKLSNSMFRF